MPAEIFICETPSAFFICKMRANNHIGLTLVTFPGKVFASQPLYHKTIEYVCIEIMSYCNGYVLFEIFMILCRHLKTEKACPISHLENATDLLCLKVHCMLPSLCTPYLTALFQPFQQFIYICLLFLIQAIRIKLYIVMSMSNSLLLYSDIKSVRTSQNCSFLLITNF